MLSSVLARNTLLAYNVFSCVPLGNSWRTTRGTQRIPSVENRCSKAQCTIIVQCTLSYNTWPICTLYIYVLTHIIFDMDASMNKHVYISSSYNILTEFRVRSAEWDYHRRPWPGRDLRLLPPGHRTYRLLLRNRRMGCVGLDGYGHRATSDACWWRCMD